jgi:uncharacterized repeat protein (TIGR03803 family)
VFKLDSSGTETVLYSFTVSADGGCRVEGLIRDAAGTLYGITTGGNLGNGIVFKLDSSGKETALHPFKGGTDIDMGCSRQSLRH